MLKQTFEESLKLNEESLQRIRSKYFPLMERGIITGYNIYPSLFDYSDGELFLNYLHSDLRPEDEHFQELSRVLRTGGFLEERMIVNDQLVDRTEIAEREADYVTRPGWDDPKDMRYFDFDATELSKKEAEALRRKIIGESLQCDLLLRVKDESGLRELVDLFKRYTSKYKLNEIGRVLEQNKSPAINEDAIFKAWEIPLLVCTSNKNKKPRDLNDFLSVYQFNIFENLGDTSVIASTLVRSKNKELQRFLKENKYFFNFNKKYALRVFVENYIES